MSASIALALPKSMLIERYETLPDGVRVAQVSCCDAVTFVNLPDAIELNGQVYGRSGWNSDTFVAYFRTDKILATKITCDPLESAIEKIAGEAVAAEAAIDSAYRRDARGDYSKAEGKLEGLRRALYLAEVSR